MTCPVSQSTSIRPLRLFALALALVASLLPPLVAGVAADAAKPDAEGLVDHPLLERFPEAWIRDGSMRTGEYRLPLGAPVGYPRRPEEAETLTGEVTHLLYGVPSGNQAETIFRSYRNALVAAGFEVLYACASEACGSGGAWTQILDEPYASGPAESMHYLAARLSDGPARSSVALFVAGGGDFEAVVSLDIVEEAGGARTVPIGVGTSQGNARFEAATRLGEQLGAAGKVEVYGIQFDMSAAAVRPDSKETLETIAELLRGNPDLKLYVVGHTDDTGPQALNLRLSKDRAQAVVDVLVQDHGVVRDRLSAHGLGPYAPTASNRTAEGQARNRRVELVERVAASP